MYHLIHVPLVSELICLSLGSLLDYIFSVDFKSDIYSFKFGVCLIKLVLSCVKLSRTELFEGFTEFKVIF